jgi:hypothetical protein
MVDRICRCFVCHSAFFCSRCIPGRRDALTHAHRRFFVAFLFVCLFVFFSLTPTKGCFLLITSNLLEMLARVIRSLSPPRPWRRGLVLRPPPPPPRKVPLLNREVWKILSRYVCIFGLVLEFDFDVSLFLFGCRYCVVWWAFYVPHVCDAASLHPQLLMDPSCTIVTALGRAVDAASQEKLARELVYLWAARDDPLNLMQICMDFEVGYTTKENTLFRVNSLASYQMKAYTKMV